VLFVRGREVEKEEGEKREFVVQVRPGKKSIRIRAEQSRESSSSSSSQCSAAQEWSKRSIGRRGCE
tara:strand:+ start:1491 stop:1688 length:198 start_codon:yes stop_codon:yes gene_type:complete